MEPLDEAFELVPRIGGFEPHNQANAWNGLGNACLIAGQLERAIEYCGRAVAIMPSYAAAWSDLFWAYDGRAQQGHVDLAGLRRASAGFAASGDAELVAQAGPEIERTVEKWEALAK